MDIKKYIKKRKLSDYLFYTLAILCIVAFDQLTKFLAVSYLKPVDTLPIIDGVFQFNYEINDGAAFGMLDNAPWIFNTVTVITVVCLLLYLYLGHASNRLYALSTCMIIGGGIGNMIDRISLKYVVDFIDFCLIDFAVFNIADSFICVGAGLLILAMVLDIVREERAKKRGQNETDSR